MTETRKAPAVVERINYEDDDQDAWICACGNTPAGSGFYPCDKEGNGMEPAVGSGWGGLYVCSACGRMIQAETGEVVGRNPDPAFLP
jgi:hypothetical protein